MSRHSWEALEIHDPNLDPNPICNLVNMVEKVKVALCANIYYEVYLYQETAVADLSHGEPQSLLSKLWCLDPVRLTSDTI